MQQQALSSQMESFQKQLADMLHTFTEQTGTNNNLDSEFQQFGTQLGTLVKIMEKGNDEICTQLSALSVHMAEEATETHKFLAMQVDEQRADILRTLSEQTDMSNNFRSELQQLGRQFDTITNIMQKGNGDICTQIAELMIHMTADARESHKLLAMLVNEQEV